MEEGLLSRAWQTVHKHSQSHGPAERDWADKAILLPSMLCGLHSLQRPWRADSTVCGGERLRAEGTEWTWRDMGAITGMPALSTS